MVIGTATLVGALIGSGRKKFKSRPEVFTLLLYILWMCITTLFALNPQDAWPFWAQVMKVQLMVFVALLVLNDRRHVFLLIWVLVISLGFYGVKGGIFALTTGGGNRVWGPPESFIADNNSLALALCMNIPLMYFLLQNTQKRWVKLALAGGMMVCAMAILGSQSRGALLAIGAMAVFLWWKSPHKLALAFVLPVVAMGALLFMPERWWDRMETIQDYTADRSAMERIWAWKMAFNVAVDRPLLGGGFQMWTPEVYSRYAEEWFRPQAAHSVYFQVLGEQGFAGLLLYSLVWLFTWRNAGWLIRKAQREPQFKWAGSLASMMQVSLVAYAVGGAFLSVAYWDVPYYGLVALVVARFAVSGQENLVKGHILSGDALDALVPAKLGRAEVVSAKVPPVSDSHVFLPGNVDSRSHADQD
jgi:probable O-glycosylation ligase (exosortase A-associated)